MARGIRTTNFTYVWGKRGTSRLPNKVIGINGPVLTIPNLVDSDEGLYYCVVTNEWNSSVISDDIALAIEGMCLQSLHSQSHISKKSYFNPFKI